MAEAENLLEGMPSRADRDEEEHEVFFAAAMVRAKLAGALSGWNGEQFDDHGFAIACLKRVLAHIDNALKIADDTLSKKLLALRQNIIDLQQELRR